MPSPVGPYPYSVTLADGSIDKFTIKALTISQLYQWLYLARDQGEPAMVALCTGKDAAWVDSLDVDSFAKLAGKCSELNFPQALRLAKGAPVAAALIAPLIQRNLLGLQVAEILSGASGASSTTPLPSASAAATVIESPKPTPLTDSALPSERAAA